MALRGYVRCAKIHALGCLSGAVAKLQDAQDDLQEQPARQAKAEYLMEEIEKIMSKVEKL